MDADELAARIDHTLLKQEASAEQVMRLCGEAIEFHFAAVCINPGRVRLAADRLAGSDVAVCSVVGFPLGASLPALKAAEAEQALRDGASEIDMVLNIGLLRDGDVAAAHYDVATVKRVTGKQAILKVIIEAAILSREEIITASRLAVEAGADLVKTSTGFNPAGGARLDDVRLIRQAVGDGAGVKAAGGIRDLDTALAMIEAGADRLGTSSSVAIIQAAR
jgi:deoxyribose-phosphate aldolase